jgi:uncharacterized protein YjiS (DUF1127 family)
MREAAFEIARQSDDFAPSLARQFVEAVTTRFARLVDAWKLAKLHRMLEQLDDRQLDDIGVTRAEIHRYTGRTESVVKTIVRIQGNVNNCGWQCAGR